MYRLTCFELDKVWRKRSFLLSVAVLLAINIFLLWYTNLPNNETPPLSAYKAVEKDLQHLSEAEKKSFIEDLYEDSKGVMLVNDILNMQNSATDMGKELGKKTMAENPGVFEKYYKTFTSGKYLKYTDSLEQEMSLIKEIYEESEKVSSYGKFLKDIKDRKKTLESVSVFQAADQNSFSARNITKEAADYQDLSAIKTEFYPSKGLTSAVSAQATDLLLLLLLFLFAGTLIYEEKEKKLFLITRVTPAGREKSIIAKLTALLIQCFAMTFLFYGVNVIFFSASAGVGNLLRSLQSVAPYMGSDLQISLLAYLLLTVVTKAILLFSLGAFLVFIAIIGKQSFLPYLAGTGLLAISSLLYLFVPASSSVNWLKYLNPIGLLQTDTIYGGYLNFNLFGYPLSRLLTSWVILGLYAAYSCFLAVKAFLTSRSLEISKLRLPTLRSFHPHVNLCRHEGYKIFIMNRALLILLTFAILFGYQHLSKTYTLTPAETYYQNIMTELSGDLTEEKTSLIEQERKRYEEAFAKIKSIDEMVAKGKISMEEGENIKSPYYSETAFYPSFQRVLQQYDYVVDSGGKFVYDTGYLLIFGLSQSSRSPDLILFTVCIIFAFSALFSMEYRDKSWNLLAATRRGKRDIYKSKLLLAMAATTAVFASGWVCQIIQVARSCPLREITSSTMALAQLREMKLDMPLAVLLLLMALLQILSLFAVLMVTVCLSDRLKNHIQTLSVSVLLLIVPLILNEMGLTFGKWVSLLPLYDCVNSVLINHGLAINAGYLAAAAVLLAGGILTLRKSASK